jgi:hypothetical protein
MSGHMRIVAAATLLAVAVVGCGGTTPAPNPKAAPKQVHAHPDKGPHGGALVEWGEEDYHVEFTVDHKTQEATAYVLDGSAKKTVPVKAKTLTLTLKQQPPVNVTLEARPQEGEPAGTSSRFVGKHAALGEEREFQGTISGDVEGVAYAGDFKEKAGHKHAEKP